MLDLLQHERRGLQAGLLDHVCPEPALVVNVIKIWMQGNIRRIPRDGVELGLIAVAAGRN